MSNITYFLIKAMVLESISILIAKSRAVSPNSFLRPTSIVGWERRASMKAVAPLKRKIFSFVGKGSFKY